MGCIGMGCIGIGCVGLGCIGIVCALNMTEIGLDWIIDMDSQYIPCN
jgi:hypothetical protein